MIVIASWTVFFPIFYRFFRDHFSPQKLIPFWNCFLTPFDPKIRPKSTKNRLKSVIEPPHFSTIIFTVICLCFLLFFCYFCCFRFLKNIETHRILQWFLHIQTLLWPCCFTFSSLKKRLIFNRFLVPFFSKNRWKSRSKSPSTKKSTFGMIAVDF